MNRILLLVFIVLDLFVPTIQISCWTNCSIIHVKSSDPFIDPANSNSCVFNTTQKICKGYIIAYYNGKNYPKYINYTFDIINDISERKNENDIVIHGLRNFTKYQVIVNAKNEETYIIADIYCTIDDNCALIEIKKLFFKYNHQLNPFYELESLIYTNPPPEKIYCYDITNNRSEECINSNHYPVCLSYSKDLKQECSYEYDIHIHEEFILTYPEQVQFNLMDELIRCNKDNCNHIEILTKIQNISRNYAYGNRLGKNHAHKKDKHFYYIGILFFVFVYSHL